MNIEQARFNMIEQQIRPWDVLDQTVLTTFGFIPREAFVPDAWKNLAFADVEIPLGHDETMMHPKVEARLLQALNVTPDDNCLEIGTGSGFVTACLAHLSKHVDSVDIHEDFTRQAEQRLLDSGLKNYSLHTGDALRSWSSGQLYNIIAVTGALPNYLPRFEEQLAVGGRLFIVIGTAPAQHAMLVTRQAEGEFTRQMLFETGLKPLLGAVTESRFVF